MPAPEDLDAFCRREWPRLVGTLSLYCGDALLAEELAQEALERVCRRWSRIRDLGAPGPYVHRIAINLANSRFRRRRIGRRAHARYAAELPRPVQDPPEPEDRVLRAAITALPERQRAAMVLRYVADLTAADTGELLGCSEQAVRNLTHRATAVLRAALGQDDPEEASDRA